MKRTWTNISVNTTRHALALARADLKELKRPWPMFVVAVRSGSVWCGLGEERQSAPQ